MEEEFHPEQPVTPQPGQIDIRQRGGQPGNQNARKYGFYAKTLSPEVKEKLYSAAQVEGLDQEIALLRAKIAVAAEDPAQSSFLLSGISLLTRTLRTQKDIGGGKPSLQQAIANILRDAPLPVETRLVMEQNGVLNSGDCGGTKTNPDEYPNWGEKGSI